MPFRVSEARMTSHDTQKGAFLDGEGDAWWRRNQLDRTNQLDQFDHAMLRQINKPSSVLEIGCADGRRLDRLVRELQEPVEAMGIDPSGSAIQHATETFPTFTFKVGTADQLPTENQFDLVILGFCLYLCDRNLLPKIVAETDRVLADGGQLVIIDFDPPHPRKRRFHHKEGIWSFKMDYSKLFDSFPQYSISFKASMRHADARFSRDETERVGVWILNKELELGYSEEFGV